HFRTVARSWRSCCKTYERYAQDLCGTACRKSTAALRHRRRCELRGSSWRRKPRGLHSQAGRGVEGSARSVVLVEIDPQERYSQTDPTGKPPARSRCPLANSIQVVDDSKKQTAKVTYDSPFSVLRSSFIIHRSRGIWLSLSIKNWLAFTPIRAATRISSSPTRRIPTWRSASARRASRPKLIAARFVIATCRNSATSSHKSSSRGWWTSC